MHIQPTISTVKRSSMHRCLRCHRLSTLPYVEVDKPDKKKFQAYPIGHSHIYFAAGRTA